MNTKLTSGHLESVRNLTSWKSVARTLLIVTVAFSAAATFAVQPAAAHAELASAVPSDGANVQVSPSVVSLTFNEPVSGKAGSVQLLDANAKVVRRSPAVASATATLPGKALQPGRYLIRWSVASADGHIIVGSTAFVYKTATMKTSSQTITLNGPEGKIVAKISGNKPGVRNIVMNGIAGEASLELRSAKFGAPLVWKVQPNGTQSVAGGVLPAAGTWEVTLRVRTSTFDQSVYTGSLTLKN